MKLVQAGRFAKAIKRLHPQEKVVLDNAIKALIETPEAGELKLGDLAGVRVYKFKVNLDRMLLAYLYNKELDTLTLLAYGSHENFYRDLIK